MAYWLLKSEPDVFGWDHLLAKGAEAEEWSGIRNYQARNFLRAMAVGDRAFFYHSNIGKAIVGVARITRTAAPDSTNPTWDAVMVQADFALNRPVTLEECRQHPELVGMVLVKNPRLSVQPVTDAEWQVITRLGGIV